MSDTKSKEDPKKGQKTLMRLALLGLVVAAVVYVGFIQTHSFEQKGRVYAGTVREIVAMEGGNDAFVAYLKNELDAKGIWGPIIYIAIYIVAPVLLFPGSVLTLAAGLAFKLWLGVLYVTIGANIGANMAFLFARYVAGDSIAKKLPKKMRELNDDLETKGLQTILFLRLIPLFPFNLINYLCGVTKMKWSTYAFGTLVGMLPGTFIWVYAATSATKLSLSNPVTWIPIALFVGFMFVPKIYKKLTTQKVVVKA